MKDYKLQLPKHRIFDVFLFSLWGLGSFYLGMLWPLGLIVVNGKTRPNTPGEIALVAICLLIGSFASYLAWGALREPCRLRLGADGVLELHRMLGKSTITLGDIRSIERRLVRELSADEDPSESRRLLRIRLAHSSVDVPYFDQAEAFLAELAALRLGLAIRDGWVKE